MKRLLQGYYKIAIRYYVRGTFIRDSSRGLERFGGFFKGCIKGSFKGSMRGFVN